MGAGKPSPNLRSVLSVERAEHLRTSIAHSTDFTTWDDFGSWENVKTIVRVYFYLSPMRLAYTSS